ncbi:MAG: sugar phosphate nucleotidyltransferase, partial [Pseudomonadota bacterium]
MTYVIHPVILCGGSGTRLWPLSTPQTPKQFLALTTSKSMIEETAERFQSTVVAGVRAGLESASNALSTGDGPEGLAVVRADDN